MKKNKIVLLTALIAMLIAFTEVFAVPVTVNLSAEKQMVRGFGGMNHPAWIGDLTAAQRETVFGNEPNQLGFTVLRIFVNENSNDWQKDLPTAKYASDRGILVFASPWNPPSSMRTTGQSTYNSSTEYSNTNRIRTDMFSQYVGHLNAFIKFMEDNGVNLHAISVQNEPDYGYHGDWTEWTAAEILTFMKEHAGNINSRVITPEPFQYRKNELNAILNDPVALANTDIFGTHIYGTLPRDFAYPLFKEKGAGKELWMTEVYHPNSSDDADLWPGALNTAVHVHRALVDGGFQTYVWWYIRRYYSPLLENGTISKRGWMMAHFSKFVRPGYVRVDATPAMPKAETPVNNSTGGNGGTFVSAYKGEDGKVVIVAVNRDVAATSIEFTINGGTVQTMEAWRTTETQNIAKLSDVSLNNGSTFSVSVPAQSVTTFVGVLLQITPSSSSAVPSSSSSEDPQICGEYETGFCGGMAFADVLDNSTETPTAGQCIFIEDFGIIQPWLNSTISINGIENVCGSEWDGCGYNTKPATKDGGYYVYVETGRINKWNDNDDVVAKAKPECGPTPIAHYPQPVVNSKAPTYYTIKGEPVGSTKPTKPGVYLVKQGSSVRKIVVR